MVGHESQNLDRMVEIWGNSVIYLSIEGLITTVGWK